jgi:hypothetical protein
MVLGCRKGQNVSWPTAVVILSVQHAHSPGSSKDKRHTNRLPSTLASLNALKEQRPPDSREALPDFVYYPKLHALRRHI